MIQSHFGIEQLPFNETHPTLLPHQQYIFDTLQVHARQGGLCLILGEPGTGKSIIKHALIDHDPKRCITPAIGRTLHTYSGILRLLTDAFKLDVKGVDVLREKALIDQAWKINSQGKRLIPIIDDAHLMDLQCLRKLRLLFEDFPKNHNLVLIAQPGLLRPLQLMANEDIRSRITYSVLVKPLNPDDLRAFIFAQLDTAKLAHNVFSDDALDLIIRSAEGLLRRTRNLCLSTLIEAVRDRVKIADLDQVNRVLLQPHWRTHRASPLEK